MAKASLAELESLLRSVNFFRNKAKSLKACSETLVEKHQGEVPREMMDLVALAGVGRKTANVVLGNAFGLATGVVVDTHVGRLSQRLGWSKAKTPQEIEKDLMRIFPEKEWVLLAHLLITLGRDLCKARNPQCRECFLFDACPKRGVK